MQRRSQFGMRENPASNRRHGSRSVLHENLSPVPSTHSYHHRQSFCESGVGQAGDTDRGFATGGRGEGATPSTDGERHTLQIENPTEFETLLDVTEAAKLLRIHPKTLRTKASRGIIPAIQIGRVWRFRASMLNRWLEHIAK